MEGMKIERSTESRVTEFQIDEEALRAAQYRKMFAKRDCRKANTASKAAEKARRQKRKEAACMRQLFWVALVAAVGVIGAIVGTYSIGLILTGCIAYSCWIISAWRDQK